MRFYCFMYWCQAIHTRSLFFTRFLSTLSHIYTPIESIFFTFKLVFAFIANKFFGFFAINNYLFWGAKGNRNFFQSKIGFTIPLGVLRKKFFCNILSKWPSRSTFFSILNGWFCCLSIHREHITKIVYNEFGAARCENTCVLVICVRIVIT